MAKKIKDENGNTYVQKKPFYKRVWFWVLIVLVIIIGASAMGGKKGNSAKPTPASSNSSSSTSNGITKSQWDKIKLSESDGNSVDSVKKAFGKPNSTSTSTVENVKADMYTWNHVANASLGGTVVIGFSNDHAISKSIANLKVSRSKKITLNDFNTIQNGQTKSQVESKFGKPDGYDISTIAGQTTEIWMYTSGIKGSAGANFNVTFSNDAVSGMTQSSME